MAELSQHVPPKPRPVTLAERTEAVESGIVTVLEHHDCPTRTVEAFRLSLKRYLEQVTTEGDWCKHVKYLLTYPMAKYLRNELPAPPAAGPIQWARPFRGWLKARINAFNAKNTHLWYSWYQAKRSALPMSDDMIAQAYSAHFDTLTSPDAGETSDYRSILNNPDFVRVLDRVRTGMMKLLKDDPDLNSFVYGKTSLSASFEDRRKDGGQVASLRKACKTWMGRISTDPLPRTDSVKELVSMRWLPRVYRHGHIVSEVRSTYEMYGRDEWVPALTDLVDYVPNSTNIDCSIQAVLEPMKIRIISKGESLAYYSVRPIQKAMHTAMRRMPCFRLIGQKFSPADLHDLVDRAQPSYEWMSVDYVASTDGLSWLFSQEILKSLIRELPEKVQKRALLALGPHRLHYPVYKKNGTWGAAEPAGIQRTGQLMGSILSFPILCLANLAVYLHASKFNSHWDLDDRLKHVLVNGDDMLYCGPPETWRKHVKAGLAVGLRMSPGKAYHHPVYANINSTSVHFAISRNAVALPRREVPRQIDFLNTGLLQGRHKVLGRCKSTGEDEEYVTPASTSWLANLPEILKGCLQKKQCAVLAKLLSEQASEIAVEARVPYLGRKGFHHRNIFLPVSSGGCGVQPPEGWKWRVTKTDVKVARAILRQNTGLDRNPLIGPLLGHELEETVDPVVPWQNANVEGTTTAEGRDWKMVGKACPTREFLKRMKCGFRFSWGRDFVEEFVGTGRSKRWARTELQSQWSELEGEWVDIRVPSRRRRAVRLSRA